MKAAVYPFGQVMRSLRTEAGIPILRARELTQYKNYERWKRQSDARRLCRP
jgi:hypothetical protein